MADTQPSPPSSTEINLEDIDQLLAAEDPEFSKQLEDVRAVESDTNVEIEASAIADGSEDDKPDLEKPKSFLKRLRWQLREKFYAIRLRLKNRFVMLGKDLVVFLKTRPKEYALYAFAVSKIAAKQLVVPVHVFRTFSLQQKLLALVLVTISAVSLIVVFANFKGIWLPSLQKPIVYTFETQAEFVETFDPRDPGESFYSAFPQERHEFLFRKMKVNLRRTSDNPLPMGAFEIIVQVDSKDSAIEIGDREVELYDLLSRIFEEQSFADLESELGKAKVKSQIKRELNNKLTQGWIKEVSFKTFVLKP